MNLSVIIPAYNEEESIAGVVRGVSSVLHGIEHEIIVVNDASTDGTAQGALDAGAVVAAHHVNRGYGGALKTGIRKAKYDWISILDADGQHDPNDLLRLVEKAGEGFDMVIGARDRSSFQYASRMPGKMLLQGVAHYLVGERPQDVNSGLRLFRKADAIAYFPILPNAFSFTTTLTLAMMKDGFQVGHIPIRVRERQGRASTVSLKDGLRTLMLIIRIATLFNPLKVYLPVSILLSLLGIVYAVLDMVSKAVFNIPDGAILLMLAGVIIFFFAILSDQLSSIRRLR